jgi:hypothetical protein
MELNKKEYDYKAFKIFAKLHPVEAYDLQPDYFFKFMRNEGYKVTDEQVKELINESR